MNHQVRKTIKKQLFIQLLIEKYLFHRNYFKRLIKAVIYAVVSPPSSNIRHFLILNFKNFLSFHQKYTTNKNNKVEIKDQ